MIFIFIYFFINKKEKFTNIPKVGILIAGFAPRSLKYTHKTITDNIINHLKNNNFDVDVIMFSLLSRNNNIESNRKGEENVKIDNNDIKLLKTNVTKTEYQENIDEEINKHCGCKNCFINKGHFKNFIRDIYSEQKCINTTNLDKYDACILLGPDFYIVNKINIKEIDDVIKAKKRIVYTTSYNDSFGIANKFYICKPEILKIICNRYNDVDEWNNNKHKYLDVNNKLNCPEVFLKNIINKNNIQRKISKMFYIKVRSNGKANWYIKKIKNFIKDKRIFKKVYNKFN